MAIRNTELLRQMLGSAGLLAGVAAAAALLLAAVWLLTHERIAENERRSLLAGLHEILPPESHDNDLQADTLQIRDPELLGTQEAVTAYRAYRDGEPVGVLFPVVAPDGYGGPIRLLVGIRADGTLAGVRVIAHRETPGLGDKIELARSDWIRSFTGKSLNNPPRKDWAVRKDGGAFDQFTGATVTPRAVVEAVEKALVYFQRHRRELFSAQRRNGTGE